MNLVQLSTWKYSQLLTFVCVQCLGIATKWWVTKTVSWVAQNKTSSVDWYIKCIHSRMSCEWHRSKLMSLHDAQWWLWMSIRLRVMKLRPSSSPEVGNVSGCRIRFNGKFNGRPKGSITNWSSSRFSWKRPKVYALWAIFDSQRNRPLRKCRQTF